MLQAKDMGPESRRLSFMPPDYYSHMPDWAKRTAHAGHSPLLTGPRGAGDAAVEAAIWGAKAVEAA